MKRSGPLRRGKPLQRRAQLRSRKRIPRESKKHKALREGWAEIKQRRIDGQEKARGYTWCERCGRRTPHLQLHHSEYAGRGGAWTEENGELICSWPEPDSCHDLEHGRPWQPPKTAQ